jgi:hypothetical protein
VTSLLDEFRQVFDGSLPVLVAAARKEDGIEEYDVIFRIKALQTLSELGTQGSHLLCTGSNPDHHH